jgi:hypothetical protein
LLEKLKSKCKTAEANSQNSNTGQPGCRERSALLVGTTKQRWQTFAVSGRVLVSKQQRFLRD